MQTVFVTARRDLATPGNLGRRVDLPRASPPLLDLGGFYAVHLGRFIGRDPILYKGGDFNLYRYCDNRPLTYTDPIGTSCTFVGVAAYGAEYPATASAPGLGAGVSPNPGPVGVTPVTIIHCTRTRVVNAQYTCTERYGFCWLWTRTYTKYASTIQTNSFDVDISPRFLFATGIELPRPKVPGEC